MMYVPPYNELLQIPKPARAKGDRWGFCGIAAISAAIGVPPLEVYKAMPDWPGYTPSRMIVSTLDRFGYNCNRVLVPRDEQRQWPRYRVTYPSHTALARIYFGEGKFANSHWFVFHWDVQDPGVPPMIYDNAIEIWRAEWGWTGGYEFYNLPAKLKSLYFVIRKSLGGFEGICLH